MKKTKAIKLSVSVLSFVLAFSFIFAFFVPALALGAEPEDFDLSRQGFIGETYNDSISASELLENVFSLSLSEDEKTYLDTHGGIKIVYPKSIPTSYVTYSHTDATLTVRAGAYSYLAANGRTISWIPSSVSLSSGGDADLIKSGDEYLADIVLENFSKDLSIELSYTCSIKIPKTAVNELLGKAYYDGKYYHEANTAYLIAYEKYVADKAQYEIDFPLYSSALADYNTKYALYQKYLSDKKVYEEKLAKYNVYLAELEEYKADLQLYCEYEAAMEKYRTDYQAYLDSEAKREALADEILAYEEYLAAKEKADYRIGLVESLKVRVTDLERSLYSAITGDTVTTVIENEDVIAGNLIGADRGAVEMAGDSTTWLRRLYEVYFSKETVEEKYVYYKLNYRRFRDNTVNLFRALDNLYQNERVREVLAANEKDEKYRILLAQLYLASLAYSDVDIYTYDGTAIYDSNYRIISPAGALTAREIVGDDGYYVDRNFAEPASDDLYPAPVEMPDYTPVPKPTQPKEVKAPTAPEKVDEPIPPAVVEEPTVPIEPEEPKAPEKPYQEGGIEEKIAEAYLRSELSNRESLLLTEDMTLEITVKVTKSFSASTVTVYYHDENGTLIGAANVDKGSFAEINFIPEKSEDYAASYVFSAWVDENGNELDLNCVETDISVYPKFEKIMKKYSVKWHIGDEISVTEVLYGETPIYGTEPALPSTPSVSYEFLGWSLDGTNIAAPTAVSGNADYYAVFKPHYAVAIGDTGASVSVVNGTAFVDLGACLTVRADISKLIAYAEGGITFNLNGASVTVAYSELLVLKSTDVKDICIDISTADRHAEFFVDFFSVSGERIETPIKLSVSAVKRLGGSDLYLFSVGTTEKQYFRFTDGESNISFNLDTGIRVRLANENKISLFKNQLVEFHTDLSAASPGENVNISVQIPDGIKVTGYYYVTSSGEEVRLSESSFVMPASSVTVGVFAERSVYEVIFISDGFVVSKHNYYYGETLVLPGDPTKPEDEDFRYIFIGWSPDIQTTVTADASYTAVFESEAVEKGPEEGGLKVSESVMRMIVAFSIFALLTLSAFVPAFLMFVLYRRRSRRVFAFKKFRK